MSSLLRLRGVWFRPGHRVSPPSLRGRGLAPLDLVAKARGQRLRVAHVVLAAERRATRRTSIGGFSTESFSSEKPMSFCHSSAEGIVRFRYVSVIKSPVALAGLPSGFSNLANSWASTVEKQTSLFSIAISAWSAAFALVGPVHEPWQLWRRPMSCTALNHQEPVLRQTKNILHISRTLLRLPTYANTRRPVDLALCSLTAQNKEQHAESWDFAKQGLQIARHVETERTLGETNCDTKIFTRTLYMLQTKMHSNCLEPNANCMVVLQSPKTP